MKTNFQKVSELNVLFGNEKGEMTHPNLKAIRKQTRLCGEESVESIQSAHPGVKVVLSITGEPLPTVNMRGLMDDVGDMLTVAYGVAHVAGFDADEVYNAVHKSNMTKFIPTEEDILPALQKYYDMGAPEGSLYTTGEAPTIAIKVGKEFSIGDKVFPEGKFLKNLATFVEPDFTHLLPESC